MCYERAFFFLLWGLEVWYVHNNQSNEIPRIKKVFQKGWRDMIVGYLNRICTSTPKVTLPLHKQVYWWKTVKSSLKSSSHVKARSQTTPSSNVQNFASGNVCTSLTQILFSGFELNSKNMPLKSNKLNGMLFFIFFFSRHLILSYI